jgi:hypothetical protein
MGMKLYLIRREEHRLMIFENMVFRRIFGPHIEEVAEENCILRSLVIYPHHRI